MIKTEKKKTLMPELGKITPEVFNRTIYPRLGHKNPDVLKGPKNGVDCGVIRISQEKVMAVTCDPFYVVPEYGWERAAWFAFHILASDISTTGLKPEYFSVDLNLPPSIKDEEFEILWETVDRECRKYGVSIITGHTAKYPGCAYPMVGGAFMMATGKADSYVTSDMAREGDLVLITKGAAVEAAAIMAMTFREKAESVLGESFRSQAEKLFYKMSTLKEALLIADYGLRDKGVTAMHDATECGVLGGLYEMAASSGKGLKIYKDEIIVEDSVGKICSLFGMDPYVSISEGTLLCSVRPEHAEPLKKRLLENGIISSVCGEFVPEGEGIKVLEGGVEKTLEHPRLDPFWTAFASEMALKGAVKP